MRLFGNLFKSKEKRIAAQKYKLGMKKTRDSVFNNLKNLLDSSELISDDLFDELEEIFIMADIGVDTVVKFVNHLRSTVDIKDINTPEKLYDLIVEEMYKLYVQDEIMISNLEVQNDRLNIVLFVGVNGVGKTTTIGKVANEYIKKGKKVMLVAGDTFRAGAINQLKIWAERVGAEFYAKDEGSDPSSVMYDAIKKAQQMDVDIILCDTAGRLQNKKNLITELDKINRVIGREVEGAPHETLLVIDATTGQNGLSQAKIFNEVTNITGIVLTKLDGDSRGGAALSIRQIVDKPIKFISTGEKMEALDQFYPDRMANRILGMGDVLSLVERAQQAFDEDEAARLNKKIRQNNFTFEDFYAQLQQIKKMGNIKDLLGMLPGVGSQIKDMDIDDNAFKGIESMIQSMTPQERSKPEILNASRKQRIVKGSGRNIQDLNKLLAQFEQMRKMMKMMNNSGGKMPKMPNMPGMRR